MKIALCTIATGKDPIYFESVKRYLPYNREYFMNGRDVDFLLFTDQSEAIDGVQSHPYQGILWPYSPMLKNNVIGEHFDQFNLWDQYDYIYFIDADFAIGDYYDFFQHEFVMINVSWGEELGGGGFYGGKSSIFRELYETYREEIATICNNKLSVPLHLDEFYLGLFRKSHSEHIHMISMDDEHTLFFYDSEDLDTRIKAEGRRKLFMFPQKTRGRANTVTITHPNWKQESVINLKEGYLFIVYHHDIGHLLKITDRYYRILWLKHPSSREILDVKTNTIICN